MLSLILTVAVIGLIVWAIVTYIPMEPPFKGIIIVIAILALVAIVFGGGNLGTLGTSGCLRL